MKNINVLNFEKYWNEFMMDWYDLNQNHANITNFQNDYTPFFINNFNIIDYFPEPYFGDPNNQNIKAVFINLNPGNPGPSQSFQNKGNYIKEFETYKKNYVNTINTFDNQYNVYSKGKKPVAYGTMEWWYNYRVNWVRDLFNYPKIGLKDILGIELSPWHTPNFKSIQGSLNQNLIKTFVIDIASDFSKTIKNPYLRNNSKSIILTCGSGFYTFFRKESWHVITPEFLQTGSKTWCVRRWDYNVDTIILNIHQTKAKRPPLEFPFEMPVNSSYNTKLRNFLKDQLK